MSIPHLTLISALVALCACTSSKTSEPEPAPEPQSSAPDPGENPADDQPTSPAADTPVEAQVTLDASPAVAAVPPDASAPANASPPAPSPPKVAKAKPKPPKRPKPDKPDKPDKRPVPSPEPDGRPDGKPDAPPTKPDPPDITIPVEPPEVTIPVEPKPPSLKPRDLKVLPRSWSMQQVDSYMKKQVKRGLGVECSYCHKGQDYAAAHPMKTKAREMMRMTNALNRQYFKGRPTLTCFTCHKGQKEP